MSNSPKIIIIAISSRPYVEMAVNAGYQVIAIDAFADDDLVAIADEVYQMPVEEGCFQRDALTQLFQQLDCSGVIGLCYGAGFEAQPELINLLEQFVPMIGNTAETIKACKDIKQFTHFCEEHAFSHPAVSDVKPSEDAGWLVKTAVGSGGAHIRYATSTTQLDEHQYYQQFQKGMPISCLFLCNGTDVKIVGLNEQWCDASNQAPFRYGGAVSHLVVQEDVKHQMQAFLQAAVKYFGLVGLNSCDAILYDNKLYFLEFNPRLSATAYLYEHAEFALFEYHIDACQRKVLPTLSVPETTKAHQIRYAAHDCSIIGHDWPEWVSDQPADRETILREMPMFTVNGSAESYQQAKQLVKTRAVSIF